MEKADRQRESATILSPVSRCTAASGRLNLLHLPRPLAAANRGHALLSFLGCGSREARGFTLAHAGSHSAEGALHCRGVHLMCDQAGLVGGTGEG